MYFENRPECCLSVSIATLQFGEGQGQERKKDIIVLSVILLQIVPFTLSKGQNVPQPSSVAPPPPTC